MNVSLIQISPDDRKAVIDIFNYYVENSFSAYPEEKVPYEMFDMFLNIARTYPSATIRDKNGEILGFGMLRPYNPIPTFSKTVEITYFIKPEATGKGIGKKLLEYLIQEGKNKGFKVILASISSLNEGSIKFHLKNGFIECGRLISVGNKKGQNFDVIYCQKTI